MARGRQQKWICLDCGAAFAVQGIAPKMFAKPEDGEAEENGAQRA
jgi:hypothetical protein